MSQRLRTLFTAAVTSLGHNVENELARLLAAVPGADNLNGLVLGLVARNLDLGASLLAKVVDGATTRADDKPMTC